MQRHTLSINTPMSSLCACPSLVPSLPHHCQPPVRHLHRKWRSCVIDRPASSLHLVGIWDTITMATTVPGSSVIFHALGSWVLYLRDLPSGSHSSRQECLLISPWGLAALEQVDFTPLSANGEGGFRVSCYALIRLLVPWNLGAALLGCLMPCLQKTVRNPRLLHTQPQSGAVFSGRRQRSQGCIVQLSLLCDEYLYSWKFLC